MLGEEVCEARGRAMASAALSAIHSLHITRILQFAPPSTSRLRRTTFVSPRCSAHDLLLQSAQHRAARRAAETSRNEPLFHDPYAACLAAVDEQVVEQSGRYELATRFIDEEVLDSVKRGGENPIRQVVLLGDGMDTRAFRLPWPPATMVFDVSPGVTHSIAAERLEAVGARIQRGCILRHVSVELSEDGDWRDASWERYLLSVGYQGTRPSIWTMQGLQTLTSEGLEIILRFVSSLAVKDSIFLGELPCRALGDISQEHVSAELSRVFASHGFHVKLVPHKEVSTPRPLTEMNGQDFGAELVFVAKQLRLSDHQVDDLKGMITDREEIDEEGFEDW